MSAKILMCQQEKVNYRNLERKKWIVELAISPWGAMCQDKRLANFLDYVSRDDTESVIENGIHFSDCDG